MSTTEKETHVRINDHRALVGIEDRGNVPHGNLHWNFDGTITFHVKSGWWAGRWITSGPVQREPGLHPVTFRRES